MEKLLNWSLAQSDPETSKKAGVPDPALIAQLFGAQVDDATLMKEAIAVIENSEATEEAKLIAWDNFEMLIENLDNANNIENLKLWPNLIKQLKSDDAEFRSLASSVIGTAVQNNEKSQKNFLKYEEGMPSLLELIKTESNVKALYALSSLVRNNPEALDHFNKAEGMKLLNPLIEKNISNVKKLLKVTSLLDSLVALAIERKEVLDQLKEHQILDVLKFEGELEYALTDRFIHLLNSVNKYGYKLSDDESKLISKFIKRVETEQKDDLESLDLAAVKKLISV